MTHTNLQDATSAFFGRDEELERLHGLLVDGERLVTVLGAGGIGKTRLSRELGLRLAREEEFPGGVWFVDLTAARDRDDVVAALQAALDVPLAGEVALDQLLRVLENKAPLVVVLDNFEQLPPEANEVPRALALLEEVHVVVTSRERLRIPSEYCFEVPVLAEQEAIDLFFARAASVWGNAASHADAMRDDVRRLVRHLDRMPLPIEMAAARANTLPPLEILARLERRFELLENAGVTGRQRTLESTIAWSWDLLDDREQDALRQLARFRGSFSLEAAERVLASTADALELVDALTNKSLLRREISAVAVGEARFALFESVREFVRSRSVGDEELDVRYIAFHRELADRWRDRLSTREGREAVQRLELERPNLESALEAAVSVDPEAAFAIAGALDGLYRAVGAPSAHAALLEELISLAETMGDDDARREFVAARGELRLLAGDLEGAEEDFRAVADQRDRCQVPSQVVDLLDVVEGRVSIPRALLRLGEIARRRGDSRGALEWLERVKETPGGTRRLVNAQIAACQVDLGELDEASATLRRILAMPTSEDLRDECNTQKCLGYVYYYLQKAFEQRACNRRALDLASELGDRRLVALSLQGMGDSAFARGDYEEAQSAWEEALGLHRDLGNHHFEAVLLGNLAGTVHRLGDLERARSLYEESLYAHERSGALPYQGIVAYALAMLLHEVGELHRAHDRYAQAYGVYSVLDEEEALADVRLGQSWIELELGSDDTACEAAEVAAKLYDRVENESWAALARATIDVIRGGPITPPSVATDEARLVELVSALALLRRGDVEGADTLVQHARSAPSDRERPLVQRKLQARVLVRMIERGCEPSAGLSEPTEPHTTSPELTVGADASWFEVAGAERVDLRRRRAIREVLGALIEAHGSAPLDVYALFDVGWPGQEVAPELAADRVYWAIKTLRKLGLDELIITTDDGYSLPPDLRIERR